MQLIQRSNSHSRQCHMWCLLTESFFHSYHRPIVPCNLNRQHDCLLTTAHVDEGGDVDLPHNWYKDQTDTWDSGVKDMPHSSWSFRNGHRTRWHCIPDRLGECPQREGDARAMDVRKAGSISHTNRNCTDCSGMSNFQGSPLACNGHTPTCHPDTPQKQASFSEDDGVEGEGLCSTPRRDQSYRNCSDSDGVLRSPSSRYDMRHTPTHHRNPRTRVSHPLLPMDAHETDAPSLPRWTRDQFSQTRLSLARYIDFF